MRNLHLSPLKRLSDAQRALLEDAQSGALTRYRLGWRRNHKARGHSVQTATSLTLRGFLAEEFGLLVLSKKGRAALAAREASNAA